MRKRVNGVIVDMTPEEVAAIEAEHKAYETSPQFKMDQITLLKEQLSATDYKAIKFAEGWMAEEEYAPIRAERQALRDQINALEAEL